MNANQFLEELHHQQVKTTLQATLEGIITRKCELRKQLDDLTREQAALNIQIYKIKAKKMEEVLI